MTQLQLLFGYCAAMFFGAYLSGWVTTAMQGANSRRLNRVLAIFGAGLLVGTALIVIIPEGVAMYYEALRLSDIAADAEASEGARLKPSPAHAHRRLLEETTVDNLSASLLGVESAGASSLSTDAASSSSAAASIIGSIPSELLAAAPSNVDGAAAEFGANVARSLAARRSGADEASEATDEADAADDEADDDAAADADAAEEPEEGSASSEAENADHAHTGAGSSSGDHDHAHAEGEGGSHGHGHSHGGPAIGAALVLGFAFQLVVGECMH